MPDMAPVTVVETVDAEGRRFGSAPIDHPGAAGLGIHFSAFFGAWGNARAYRDTFQGYFHRLKMLGSDESLDWLFLCDTHGVNANGSYYLGEAGDLYVERAMHEIIGAELSRRERRPDQVVTLGSSMGATAALDLGLDLGVAGIVAIGPHVDLDTSAELQDRMAEVSWICPDGDALAPHNHHLTRPVNSRLDAWPAGKPLPRLFVQSCEDDAGVHREQVLPLVERWRSMGGRVDLDVRPVGGHTSDFATRAVLLDATHAILEDRPIDVERYRTDPEFAGTITRPPLEHRVRRRLSLARKRLLRR
jgi:hypothetical protein